METGSMEVDETGSTEEVFSRPTVEYTTHEQYTMQMEREANRKLKAGIRRKKRNKGKGIKWQIENYPEQLYIKGNLTVEKLSGFFETFSKSMVSDEGNTI